MCKEFLAVEMVQLRERMRIIEDKIEGAGSYDASSELQQVHDRLAGLYKELLIRIKPLG